MTRAWRKKAKPALLALAAWVAGSCGAIAADPACEPEKLATKYPSLVGKTIKIATDGQTPPYSMRDPKDFNKLIGLDTDMARAAFECIGLPVDYMIGAWSGLLPAVIAGQADVMWDTLYYTPERAKQADFVIYQRAATGGLVQKGNPKKVKSLDDVCGIRVTAGLGTTEERVFRDLSQKCTAGGKSAIEIVTFPDIPAGARLVKNDRADLLMINLGLVDNFISQDPAAFERAFVILTDYKVGVGLAKGKNELRQAVLDAVKVLQANGTEKAIYERYGVDYALAIPAQILTE